MPRHIGPVSLGLLIVVTLLALGASQAVASHVQCGDVITKDTTLDSDLIDCPGDGLVIGAPDITLDLSGHTVKGNAIGPRDQWTYGIANGYHERVTVRDGTLRDFYVGVGIGNVTDIALRRLRIRDSHGPGIWLSETHGGLIEGNVVTGFQSAILLLAERMVIRNNVFSGNGGYGIHAFDAGDNRIERNIVSRNAGDGIHGFGMGSTLMQGNVIVANGGAGISTDDGSMDNRIDGNRIWDNGGAGVSMAAGAHQNLLEGNSVLRNGASGIFLSYGNGNVFRENRLVSNGGDGIYLGPETGDNAVRRNLTLGNGDDGVDSDGAFNTIARNVGIRNGDLGIEAVAGVTDGGGNRAFANGNPLQCVVVVCR
jgi:parallel beta-helix repeat protein